MQKSLESDLRSAAAPIQHPRIRAEVPALVALAVPIVAGLAGATSLSAVDSYMLGPLGELPLAAASLTYSVLVIFYAGLYGLMGPIGLLAGQAHGAKDASRAASILRHGIVIALIGGAAGALIMCGAIALLPYADQPPEVLEVLPQYWIAMSALLVPYTVSITIKQFLDAIGRPWTGALFSALPLAINVPLNYALIYGHWGLPALGLLGAGLASFAAYVLSVAMMWLYVRHARSMRPYHWPATNHREGYVEQIREGMPMMVQYLSEGGSFALAGLLIGWLGATALAANQIVFSVVIIIYMAPLGLSAAVAIRISQATGGGARERIRAIGLAGMSVVTVWMLVFTAALMLAGEPIARAFVAEADVVAVATAMFVAVGVMQVFDGLQSVSLGALRGILDNQWPTRVSLIAYWLIALPLSYVIGFRFGFGAAGVWAGFGIGIGFAAVALISRFLAKTRE